VRARAEGEFFAIKCHAKEGPRMGKVTLEVPSEVLEAAKMTPKELLQELALSLYQQGKLSFGKARELAGMSVWEFIALLTLRRIPASYDLSEYERDLETLKGLGRL
jgi:predicted HTH domain antitoxin